MERLHELRNIRLRELEVFVTVDRAKSVREASRRLELTAGQVSKSIQSLERHLGVRLFKRSTHGVLLTQAGTELLQMAQRLLEESQRIEQTLSGKKDRKKFESLAIAGTSFLSTHLTTIAVCRASTRFPHHKFRFLDLPPEQITTQGLRGAFEMAVHLSPLSWPKTWHSEKIGKTSWVLCAAANHPVASRPTLKQILKYPFVSPVYWSQEGLVRGNDQFPVPFSKRIVGYESSTADAAVSIICNSDQLAFLPLLLVQPFIQKKLLKKLSPPDLKSVDREVYLSVKSDMVSATLLNALSSEMRSVLSPFDL